MASYIALKKYLREVTTSVLDSTEAWVGSYGSRRKAGGRMNAMCLQRGRTSTGVIHLELDGCSGVTHAERKPGVGTILGTQKIYNVTTY